MVECYGQEPYAAAAALRRAQEEELLCQVVQQIQDDVLEVQAYEEQAASYETPPWDDSLPGEDSLPLLKLSPELLSIAARARPGGEHPCKRRYVGWIDIGRPR